MAGLGSVRGVWGDPTQPPVDQETEEATEETTEFVLGLGPELQCGEEEEERPDEVCESGEVRGVTVSVPSLYMLSRRLSADNTPKSDGLSLEQIERVSFRESYSGFTPPAPTEEDNEATQCVICLSEFCQGASVRRLACMHLFHQPCVDAWLSNNR